MKGFSLLSIPFVILFTGGVAFAQTVTFYGNATDPDNGERLYQEVHRLTLNEIGRPISETVDYVATDGRLLGQKTLDYQSLSQPDYRVEFSQRAFPEIVTVQNNTILIERQERQRLSVPDDAFAVDGGFHYFIQENFDTLLAGTAVDFEFLSAGRGSFIPLSISPAEQQGQELTLELSLQNFFLSKLVRPIVLTYNTTTRQLLRYDGLTNVPNEDGNLYTAVISYQYPEDMVSVALPAQGSPTIP